MKLVVLALTLFSVSCATAQAKTDEKPRKLVKPDDTFVDICWIPIEFEGVNLTGYTEHQLYWDGETCEALGLPTEHLIWPSRIVRVGLTENALEYEDSLKEAIHNWNEVIGREFFVLTPYYPDITVHVAEKGPPGARAGALSVRKNRRITARIEIYAFIGGEVNTLTHELGHCLGLGHDPDHKNSIMYPYYAPGRTISKADAYAIRARYGI